MNILYPKLRFASLPAMLGCAAVGAALAGVYGVVHDQVTYSISPEYFTRLKFAQFHYRVPQAANDGFAVADVRTDGDSRQ